MKNQVKIKILNSRVANNKYGYFKKYYLQLSYKQNTYNFNFSDSIHNYRNNIKLNKMDALYCILLDMRAYDNTQNIDDFANEFGYEKVSELLKAYNGCKRTSDALHRIFTDEELEQLEEEFQDY